MGSYRRHGRDCACALKDMTKYRKTEVRVDTFKADGFANLIIRREINRRFNWRMFTFP